jgi:ABC-type cobalamin/Fe3+-siderophores transport system ATPase subunit
VIRRLYVNNFRCLQNFELPILGKSSALLIGKNGSGKTTVGFALEILQKIARGTNRVGDLVKPKDFTRGMTDVPMRLEIEVELEKGIYGYSVAFDLGQGSREMRILDEKLTFDGMPIYTRDRAHVTLLQQGKVSEAKFLIDWYLVALPIIQQQSPKDPLFLFKQWLARMLILQPIPSLIDGISEQETQQPTRQLLDLGAWFTGLLANTPSAYTKIDTYLKQVMPDLEDIQNPETGTDSRSLFVRFSNEQGKIRLPFKDLSDGEKSFLICALVLAANSIYGPLFCFWDEPDSFLSLEEVGHFILTLRRAFQSGGQFVATSHNSEAIRSFSDENTLVLYRKSHLEPTIVRLLEELQIDGDLIGTLIRGDLDL